LEVKQNLFSIKKQKLKKKIALRLECTVCKTKRMNLIKRCKTVIFIDAT